MVPIDLFPEIVGVAFGLANVFGNLPGIIAPALTGSMLDHAGCPSGHMRPNTTITTGCIAGWDSCIYLAAAIGAISGILFLGMVGFDKRYR
jgi:MFS family permease